MGVSAELYVGCTGITITTLGSAVWWRIRSRARNENDLLRLEKSLPSSRDGLLLSALVVEVMNGKAAASSKEPWLGDLWVTLDEIVGMHDLKKVGAFQSTYMVASTEHRIAEESLMATAMTALDIRDAVQLFMATHDLQGSAKFGIHADIIPTVGLGSTVALSQLWNLAMNLAEGADPNTIKLSHDAVQWLGEEFDIEHLGEHPVLHTRKSA
jgi:hypothetical protein